MSSKEGFNVATLNNNFIILDTNLTHDLILEGIAREMISKVQNIRKEQDFDITDRITLYYSALNEAKEAIELFEEMIKNETLAEIIKEEVNLEDTYNLNGHDVKIKVEKYL